MDVPAHGDPPRATAQAAPPDLSPAGEGPTLVMTKGWLKSTPPERRKPQGAGPARTTFWGMARSGRTSRTPRASVPRPAAAPGLYPRSPLTSRAARVPAPSHLGELQLWKKEPRLPAGVTAPGGASGLPARP